MLPIIMVHVVGEILSQPLIRLLGMMISVLIPASLDSSLLIIELVPFLHCSFHIDRISYMSSYEVYRTDIHCSTLRNGG